MLIGAHVSALGGVENAPSNAKIIGAECFQFFSRPPQGGEAPELTIAIIKKFKQDCKKYKFADYYIHTPYFINFASKNNRIRYGSVSVVRKELERASLLAAKYVMTHLGSSRDVGDQKAIEMVVSGLNKVFDGYQGTAELLIEMSAGTGNIIGDDFKEIAQILKQVKSKRLAGICFDTAHMFESGYDFRTKEALDKTLGQFDKVIGLEKLKLLHVNDSATPLGSHIDRHAHIGEGKLGEGAFEAIMKDSRFRDINFILETPNAGGRENDIKILKDLREKNVGRR